MPTEHNPARFAFAPAAGRTVVAAFDGGVITSDAGALLLGQTDRAIRLTERFASCFSDARAAELVHHPVETLLMQRVVGIALGYEDLNDHDELRRDPDLISTKHMPGRPAASQIAAASLRSFLARLTKGFTYCGGIRRTSWPSAVSLRAQ
jgi:hypothetical protein